MSYPLRTPWLPLTDLQWNTLAPHLTRSILSGRPCGDPRGRMDAIFRLIATDAPWRELPTQFGKADTVSRHFRRLTHAGLWERLLRALAEAPPGHPLRSIEGLICRACRRAYRLRGLRLIVLARRLGLRRALPGPPWLLPDPDLSEMARQLAVAPKNPMRRGAIGFLRRWQGAIRRVLRVAEGRRHIPRSLRLAMP